MITLLKILGGLVIYVLIGIIILLIYKAVEVIQNDNSNYWQSTDDDITFVAFWLFFIISMIFIGIPYLIYIALYKGIEKIFIAVVETARAIHKIKEKESE